jgi:release factor glutamine methyltransferase
MMAFMSAAGQPSTWTVARLLSWTQNYLAEHEVEAPRLCAEILLADALQCERIRLFTAYDQVPDSDVLAKFRAHVREAATGKPIAYLTGRKEFFSLEFTVTPDVLIPRPETEILAERLIALARKQPDAVRRVLDLGTGSGCLAVSLAKHLPGAEVHASDVSEAALAVAQQNAERHGVAERITWRAGDLFAAWDDQRGAYDVIVSNPPYVATENAPVEDSVRDFEPHAALFAGSDGLAVIRRLIAEAPAYLAAEGHLLLEMGFDQAAAVRELATAAAWREIVTYRDGGGHERVLHARRPAAEQAQVA